VPERNRLEKGTDFNIVANKVLDFSRVACCFGATGIAAGAYEAALKYALERK